MYGICEQTEGKLEGSMLGLMKKIVSFHCAFFISIDKIHSTKENIKYKIGIKLIYHSFSNYLMES